MQIDRLQKRFAGWDVSGDGHIDHADWEAEAKRMVQAFGKSPQDMHGHTLTAAYLGMWSFFAEKAGIDEQSGSLTAEQFTHVAEEHILENGGRGFQRVVEPAIKALVTLVDENGDGEVNPAEFKTWLDALGVQDIDPAQEFRQLDANGDGQLTVKDLVQAVHAYHLGEIDVPLLGH
ncbi:EF-hand domain-containing protein (plasmid) [Streptomyces globisporus]|uniref:EF-hand domain-containing protein n=1 Tax=Streptomyces globisporus TaxID=1908 RepID=UPI002F914826|nr:EF-hand domain-containing protein [Streptomyces globisporus]